MTLRGKMCNGMIESVTRAFWAHTSATKRSLFLLLGLTVVSTGQGSGKMQVVPLQYLYVLSLIELTDRSLLKNKHVIAKNYVLQKQDFCRLESE